MHLFKLQIRYLSKFFNLFVQIADNLFVLYIRSSALAVLSCTAEREQSASTRQLQEKQ